MCVCWTLMCKLAQRPEEPFCAKVSIVGDPGSGNERLFSRLAGCEQEGCFNRRIYLHDINCVVDLWGLPEDQKSAEVSSVHYRSSAVCLLVYDPDSLPAAEYLIVWIADVLRFCPSHCELMLVGNTKNGFTWGVENHSVLALIDRLMAVRGLKNFIVDAKNGYGIAELCQEIKCRLLLVFGEEED
ncbi:hypothetical protein Pelo_18364 [Pelomyxa schiedti]|nr:hypothetical protein Pelo_18364 [Pelomyxa schiedti]